jgi:hypothetical protein
MAASAAKKAKPDIVAEAAKRALDDANGEVQKATKQLETWVAQDTALRDALVAPLVAGACYDAIRAQVRTARNTVWTPPRTASGPKATPEAKAGQSDRVTKLAAGNLLMFPLPGGKPLRDATRKEIGEAADFYEKQSGDMAVKARWLRLVAQSIPGRKSAGEALTDERLRELHAEARKG